MPYSNADLFRIARNNYETLLVHCVKLNAEGYWEQPEQMLKQSIQETLDIYLQSFLLLFAAQYQGLHEQQLQFLAGITDSYQLGIDKEEQLSSKMIEQARKIVSAPPILLQLFALRDSEKHTHLAIMFMDTMVNIIIAMSYLEERKGEGVVCYLKQYFQRIEGFLNADMEHLKELDERYVFRKITSSVFETGYLREELVEPVALTQPAVSPKITEENTLLYSSNQQEQEVTVTQNADEYLQESGQLQPNDAMTHADEHLQESGQPQQAEDAKQDVKRMEHDAVKPKKPARIMNPEEIAKATAQAKLALERTKDAKRAAVVENLMEELNALVGLESVKEEMRSLVNLIKVRKMRANYQMPQMEMSYHMVFTGNAGTGKTTVARMVAEIYKELGVLSKGTFVETDRAGLVAGYLGQTAMKVKEVVERAKGGVLFIDEAYSLVSREAADDYGIEAIDTLVKEMEDNRNDLVVIVAGYQEEMEHFLKSNTGLVSRFNKYIAFDDYSNEQLLAILEMMAKKAAMTLEDGAIKRVRIYLKQMSAQERKDFGNARGIRNVFEKIVTNQANRLIMESDNPSMEELSLIKEEDVVVGNEKSL